MVDRPPLVVDASAMVELLLGTEPSAGICESLRTRTLTAPAHFDAEVMSAIGRLRPTDALYIELAQALDTVVVTTDLRLACAHPDCTHVPTERT